MKEATSRPQIGMPTVSLLERPLISLDDVLTLLRDDGLTVAPHVASALSAALAGDARAVLETARILSASQRSGGRFLPDPLPLTDSVRLRFEDIELEGWEREVLLAASVCVDDRLDGILLGFGRSIEELVTSRASALVTLAAGRFSFSDARTRIWVHGTASLEERTVVHARLAEAYGRLGDSDRAAWHRCLTEFGGDPCVVPQLIGLADAAARSGESARAFRIAREAGARARGDDLTRARAIAADAALAAGCLDDAVELLETIGATHPSRRWSILPSLSVAKTLRSGLAPTMELLRWHPGADGDKNWASWGHAAGLVAGLCAERGSRTEAREWLARARDAAVREPSGRVRRDPAEAWTLFLLGEMPDPEEPVSVGLLSGTVYRALRAGLEGDTSAGIRLLRDSDALDEVGTDPLAAGFERTPIVQAYRAVAESLLWLWQGDLRAARDALSLAAASYPVALPFAGLGVALARRLELAVDGRIGVLSRALAEVLPPTMRIDQLVDRALSAYLAGETDAAAVQMSLWKERGAVQGCFALPGLDEVGPLSVPVSWEPPDATEARRLREVVRAARGGSWEPELRSVAEAGRAIVSPFERARVEALLGTAYVLREEFASGRRHLRVAQSLFAEAGAGAWVRAVDTRLTRLAEAEAASLRVETGPIPTLPAGDPLERCRMAWAPLLTERELEVAMLIAGGASNREIADRLKVSVRTVEVHAGRACTKLDVRTRASLTVLAYRTGHHV